MHRLAELTAAMSAVTVTHFRGYDQCSPTLVGPLPCVGFCLGTEDLDADVLQWFDFGAPIMSGDPVTLFIETSNGLQAGGKVLQTRRDGSWWTLCWGTRDVSSLIAVPLDHPSLHVLAIAATVAQVRIPRVRPRDPHPVWVTPQRQAAFDRIGEPAINEWRRHGFPPTRQLPIRMDSDYLDNINHIRERLAA